MSDSTPLMERPAQPLVQNPSQSMNVWAIADLHLSFARPERRERFAERWRDHAFKIEQNWRQVVRPGDLVLLPGDLSMARNHRDVQPDLAWLERLPGTKVLGPGNHDTWWNRPEKIRPFLRPSLRVVEGDACAESGVVICGARGTLPPSEDTSVGELERANRELAKLDQALEDAARLRKTPEQPLYVLWHYPPFDAYGRPGPCVARFQRAGVSVCVYGHLHTQSQWLQATQGEHEGVRYYCVAADAIGFRPLRIDAVTSTAGQD